MIRIAAACSGSALLLTLSLAFAGPNPAPKSPLSQLGTEQSARVQKLVASLGSETYRERDQAMRELFRMGPAVLPILSKLARTSDDLEVRTRLELLLPRIEAANLKASVASLLADKDGKLSHDHITGWKQFVEITGNSLDARELFAELVQSRDNYLLVTTVINGPAQDISKMLQARRNEIYSQVFMNGRQVNKPLTTADLVTMLFVESILGSEHNDRRLPIAYYLMSRPQFSQLIRNDSKQVLQKLVVHWIETRREPNDMQIVLNLLQTLQLKQMSVTDYATRILQSRDKNTLSPLLRLQAMSQLSLKTMKLLPLFMERWDDTSSVHTAAVGINGGIIRFEIQVRDFALALVLKAHEESLEAYGFEATRNMTNRNSTLSYNSVHFPSEEKRAAAFRLATQNLTTIYANAIGTLGRMPQIPRGTIDAKLALVQDSKE